MRHTNASQPRLLFVLAIAATLLMAGCAAEKRVWKEPEAGFVLEYRMPEDQVLKYQMSNEFTQNLEMSGQSLETQVNTRYQFSVKSGGLKANDYQLTVTIDSMSIKVATPQGEFSPDLSSVVGESFDMTLSPLGEEADLSGAESIRYELGPGGKRSISPDFEALFPDLAGKALKIGDTWLTTDTITVEDANTTVHIIFESSNTLEALETVNEMECARVKAAVTGVLKGEGEQQGMELTYEGDIEGTDTWYFAIKEGLLLRMLSYANIKGTVIGSGLQEMTIPMAQEINIETSLIE